MYLVSNTPHDIFRCLRIDNIFKLSNSPSWITAPLPIRMLSRTSLSNFAAISDILQGVLLELPNTNPFSTPSQVRFSIQIPSVPQAKSGSQSPLAFRPTSSTQTNSNTRAIAMMKYHYENKYALPSYPRKEKKENSKLLSN